MGSGRLRGSVSEVNSGKRKKSYLLCYENAGSGRIQILSVDTIDLVAATHVRGAGSESVVFVGQGDIQTLHVADRNGAL